MARFLKHTSCDQCGSSDAKGLYDDGSSFCFSCKHSTRGTLGFRLVNGNGSSSKNSAARNPPNDLCSHFSSDAMDWLNKSGIGVETLIKHGVRYSPSKNQIVFTWKDLDVWQARNCYEGARSRYFTSGNHDNVLSRYSASNTHVDRCILTEDCLSAIKCCEAADVDAMPLLGSNLSTTKMLLLKRYYQQVDVFLDEDKIKDAYKIAQRLNNINIKSKVYYDILDPKYIPYEELKIKLAN